MDSDSKKGGLENVNARLYKIEESLEKSLNSLEYIKEPTPSNDQDKAEKPNIDGTVPSLAYTVDRLSKIAEKIGSTITSIRYG